MKKKLIFAAVATAVLLAGCNEDAAKKESKAIEISSLDDQVSYMLGFNMARQAKQFDFAINPELIALAVTEVNAGTEQRYSDEEMQATMRAFQTEQNAKRQEKTVALGEKNLVDGKAFLEENAKKEGVIQTESGLQYEIITAGDGAIPTAKDKVVAHYRGANLAGDEFDSSYERGEPAEFPVGSLIPGWVEALQLMPVGSKWKLYIPGELAYGVGGKMNRQTGEYDIEPNAVLVFDLELLEIKSAAKKPEAPAAE